MAHRTLISTRRRVAPARREAYAAAWRQAQHAAEAMGAHAWRFVAAGREDLFLEFLEFAADHDPRRDPTLSAALVRLGSDFPAGGPAEPTEEWTEIADR